MYISLFYKYFHIYHNIIINKIETRHAIFLWIFFLVILVCNESDEFLFLSLIFQCFPYDYNFAEYSCVMTAGRKNNVTIPIWNHFCPSFLRAFKFFSTFFVVPTSLTIYPGAFNNTIPLASAAAYSIENGIISDRFLILPRLPTVVSTDERKG